jgi:CRP-like cAMP-binding protein
MSCKPEILRSVPLFGLLDDDETDVLASQVEMKTFSARERIYKIGEASGHAYVVISGQVRVTTLDEDHQEVVVDEPAKGEFFGFASMLAETPHQTHAIALGDTSCSARKILPDLRTPRHEQWAAWRRGGIRSICSPSDPHA